MTTTTINETTVQVYQVFIKATPERIWEAITKPELTRRYFYGASVDSTVEVGSPWRYTGPDGSLWGDETVFEADPPHKLVVGWRSLYDPDLADEPASRITWEIEANDGGFSLLTLVHDRLEASPKTAASVTGMGWMMILSGLKTLLETGKPLADES